jgi:hypothetical protein
MRNNLRCDEAIIKERLHYFQETFDDYDKELLLQSARVIVTTSSFFPTYEQFLAAIEKTKWENKVKERDNAFASAISKEKNKLKKSFFEYCGQQVTWREAIAKYGDLIGVTMRDDAIVFSIPEAITAKFQWKQHPNFLENMCHMLDRFARAAGKTVQMDKVVNKRAA